MLKKKKKKKKISPGWVRAKARPDGICVLAVDCRRDYGGWAEGGSEAGRPERRLQLPSTDYDREKFLYIQIKLQSEGEQFQGKGVPSNINEKTLHAGFSQLHTS